MRVRIINKVSNLLFIILFTLTLVSCNKIPDGEFHKNAHDYSSTQDTSGIFEVWLEFSDELFSIRFPIGVVGHTQALIELSSILELNNLDINYPDGGIFSTESISNDLYKAYSHLDTFAFENSYSNTYQTPLMFSHWEQSGWIISIGSVPNEHIFIDIEPSSNFENNFLK